MNRPNSLPCPDCGSPLRPCKCERERGSTKVRRRGSTLRQDPSKKLRSRTLSERFKDDPLRYGILFEFVRRKPCAGAVYVPGHMCGAGYAPASAHHLGKDDLGGLVPACGSFHDDMEEREADVERALREANQPTLEKIGRSYVAEALFHFHRKKKLSPEIVAAALRRGYTESLLQ